MKRNKKIIMAMMICLIFTTMTGCWDNRDLTEMAFVVAVGMDKADDKIEVTLQIVKPSAIKATAEGSSGQAKAVKVFSSTGQTLLEAIRNILTTVNLKVFFGHLQLIVIGEELASEGILDVLDLFARGHEVGLRADVLVAKGMTAKRVLEVESEVEAIPAMHITAIIKNNIFFAKMKKVMLIDLLKDISSRGNNVVISAIEAINKEKVKGTGQLLMKNMKVEGVAVFKLDKLVGWLNASETRGLLFVKNEVKRGIINVSNPLEKKKNVAIEIVRSKGKKDIQIKEGKIVCKIEIKAQGNIGEQQGKGDLTTPEMIKILEEETAKVIEKEIRQVVDQAQKKHGSDIFGFGEVLQRKHLEEWKKVEGNWDEEFARMSVEIKVTAKILGSGTSEKGLEAK